MILKNTLNILDIILKGILETSWRFTLFLQQPKHKTVLGTTKQKVIIVLRFVNFDAVSKKKKNNYKKSIVLNASNMRCTV